MSELHDMYDVAPTADMHRYLVGLAAIAAVIMFCCRTLRLHMGTTMWG